MHKQIHDPNTEKIEEQKIVSGQTCCDLVRTSDACCSSTDSWAAAAEFGLAMDITADG